MKVEGGGSAASRVFSSLGRALRHRNYWLFFGGQSISLIGTWVTRVATSWLVYRLTDSALMLGLAGFAGQFPAFVLAPMSGVFIDRWNRHRVLIVTQVLALTQSALLALFALRGTITIWHILALSAYQGLINAFDMPLRQAFVVEMVDDRADLPNAIALNSSMVNLARLIGPSIAGLLIAVVGEGWCFFLDAVSYVPVIASLLAMRLVSRRAVRADGRISAEMGAGFRYVMGFAPIRALLGLLALISLLGVPYMVLMPLIAGRILHGGPGTLGLLMAGAGLGALGGALYLASLRSVLGLGRTTGIATIVFGLGLVAFSRSTMLWSSLALMVVTGSAMIVTIAATNTLLQTIVEEHLRGRVMGFYTMALFGTAPLGSLLAGTVASRIGAPDTILAGGIACAVGGALFLRRLPALRRLARPVYERLGILPEVAQGLRDADAPPS